MRVLISVDMEGLPDIFYTGMEGGASDPGYAEGRKTMTLLSSALAEGYHSAGIEDIVIADAHGNMVNLVYSSLPDFVKVVKGGIRQLDMIHGIDRSVDALAMLGFHAAAGTARSSFDHTYDGSTFHRILVNGEPASEFHLCTLVAGEYGVPVILVAGDDKLRAEVERIAPWATYAQLKESSGYWSSTYDSLSDIQSALRAAAKLSIASLAGKGRKRARALVARPPIEFVFEMKRSVYADVGELVPGMKRGDGYTLMYRAGSAAEGYRVMQLLSYSSIGTEKSLTE
ncbi:MAG: M55 family metallopeptidase [Thermoplasmata archaeon]|uniref:M55 family metallopeptidase n=1 Tax=Candidatus Sysuiplasma superficiale TaxID=2823368 RepID=A0A8J7YUW9_9ARCH|nr:M55 family metallopeptidase [Candidatus Sysuiplasma superficiale]MBX8644744.1 M55 family metallopeptidase [Candidatus Sysuiplasma superficiale]MCL4347138.1 M55 family metallopeptidase [Candidatus Thermoplasmatota archaeon]